MTQWATRKYSPHVAMMKAERKAVLGPKSMVPRKKRPRTPPKAKIADGILTVLSEAPPKVLKTAPTAA